MKIREKERKERNFLMLRGKDRGLLRPRSGLIAADRLLGKCFLLVEKNNSRDEHNGKKKVLLNKTYSNC